MPQIIRPITVRKMIIGMASLAVAFSMFEGIGELSIYRPNLKGEKLYWEYAAASQAMNKGIEAAEWQRKAIEIGRRNRASLPYIVTAIALGGLGIVSFGLGQAIEARYGKADLPRPRLVSAASATCSALAGIILAGLALGGLAYLVIMSFVIFNAE